MGSVVRECDNDAAPAEIYTENHSYILARGGAGGRGNHFYLSNEARGPVTSETGGVGEVKELIIEMKIAAHVGG